MKRVSKLPEPEMLEEYDFSRGVRGKFAERCSEGTNVVILYPDVAEFFPDSEAVNEALRLLIRIAQTTKKTPA